MSWPKSTRNRLLSLSLSVFYTEAVVKVIRICKYFLSNTKACFEPGVIPVVEEQVLLTLLKQYLQLIF